MGLPDRLRKTRKRATLSMRALAGLSHCAYTSLHFIEGKSGIPGIDLVEKLATGLGIEPSWLAFGPEAYLRFRQKQPQALKDLVNLADPEPRPGQSTFRERYKGCAQRVMEQRERLGLSLRALAGAASLSYQAVLYTETGKTVPKVDTIEAIAVALDVAPGWLAYGDEEAAV